MRGCFANVRLRNQLAPGTEGGATTGSDGATTSIYDATMDYRDRGVPLIGPTTSTAGSCGTSPAACCRIITEPADTLQELPPFAYRSPRYGPCRASTLAIASDL